LRNTSPEGDTHARTHPATAASARRPRARYCRSCPKPAARIAGLFDLAGQALRIGDHAAAQADDLALKLAAIRADVETMAATGKPVTPDRIDEAFARVTAASRAFRLAAGEVS